MKFQVYNRTTGKVVGTYGTRERARKALDKADCIYGAYVHRIKEV